MSELAFRTFMGYQVGKEDYLEQFTLVSWIGGWGVRIVSQILVYSGSAAFLAGAEAGTFALYGNVMALATMRTLASAPESAWERSLGVIPMIVASPTMVFVALRNRSLFLFVPALGETLLILGALMGLGVLHMPLWFSLAGVLTSAFSGYCFGLAIAAATFHYHRFGNVAYQVAIYAVLALGGVNVPLEYWNGVLGVISAVLPLSHGLAAARDAEPLGFLVEAAVGLGWLLVAATTFSGQERRSRAQGSIGLIE